MAAASGPSVSPPAAREILVRNRLAITGTPAAERNVVGAHDAVFKQVFSVPEHAAAELAHVLPDELSSRVVWSSLRLEPGSFVDPDLASAHTDLLFSATLTDGRAALVYLLFEHQSAPHPRMPPLMIEYVAKVSRQAEGRGTRGRKGRALGEAAPPPLRRAPAGPRRPGAVLAWNHNAQMAIRPRSVPKFRRS